MLSAPLVRMHSQTKVLTRGRYLMMAQRRLLLLLVVAKMWIAIALMHFSIDHVDVMRGDFSALDIA